MDEQTKAPEPTTEEIQPGEETQAPVDTPTDETEEDKKKREEESGKVDSSQEA